MQNNVRKPNPQLIDKNYYYIIMRQLKITKSITNRGSQSLSNYLMEIARIPMISTDEEIELSHAIKQGGKEGEQARERLVKANLRFVVSVAKQYQHHGMSLSDLIDEGNIGLVKAAEKFDETRGFKFISYAVWWIRQSIMQAMAEQSRMVRIPLNQVGTIGKINNEIEHFEQTYQRRPTVEELAELTNIELDKVEQAMKADSRQTSIDAPLGDDSDNSIADMLPTDDGKTDLSVDQQSMFHDIDQLLVTTLKPREIEIVKQSFGIGCQQLTLEEIGKKYALSRERVRQIREKCISKIRVSGNAKILAKYLG